MDYAIDKSGLKLENHLILSQNLLDEYLREDNFFQLASLIKDKFKMTLNEDGCPVTRFPFCEKTVKQLVDILKLYLENDEKYSSDNFKNLLAETSKAMRTYAITEATRKHLNNYEFYETVKKIIKKFCTEEQPELYHKFTFQLLLNILTLDEAVLCMHEALFDDFCQYFIKFTANSFECYEASAIIWNSTRLHTPVKNKEIIQRIINLFMNVEEPNEYFGFLLTKFATEECFWVNYEWYSVAERGVVLGVLKSLWYKKHIQFSNSCMDCLINTVNNTSNVMMKLVNSQDVDAAYEVSISVELLSAASSAEVVLEMLEKKGKKKDLLVSAAALLITAHKAGKMPNNKFTPVVKLAELRNLSEDLKSNPVFGFKADLVRLIGNVCYKSKPMQDLAREADVIPVLLDCSNMDAKNPFIIQWVTLAIRNICEANLENQKIIAGLQRQGVVSSELLKEMGVVIHAEEMS